MPGPWEKYTSLSDSGPDVPSGPWTIFSAQSSGGKRPLPQMPALSSALHGAAQGASFGFADELEGAARGLYDRVTGKSDDLAQAYAQNRDKARGRYEKAREDNPASYMGGELAGGLGSAFVPGLGSLKAAKGAGLAAKLASAAKAGAVMGLGTSEADLTRGDVADAAEDTALGAGLGAATQGLLSGAGAALKTVTPKNVARKLANVFLNTPEEITDTYIANPKEVLSAPRRIDVSRNYQNLIDKLKNDVTEGSAQSRKILNDEGKKLASQKIADIFEGKAQSLAERAEGVMDDPETVAAYNWLKNRAEQYANKATPAVRDDKGRIVTRGYQDKKELSTNRIKDILQGIDRSTEFETAPGKFSKIDDNVRKDVRRQIDELLKSQSPAYTEQMKQVAGDTRLLDDASSIARTEGGLANVFRRLSTDQYGGGQAPREVLEAFDNRMGSDILNQAKFATAREAFDKSITNGSRNVQFFKGLLENIPYAGKPLGAVFGGTVDKYGRKLTMQAVDAAASLDQFLQRGDVQSYVKAARPLVEAAKAGNTTAALTFQLLSQSNPQALKYLDTNKEK